MSVESEILRIQHNIANTYAAVSEKGGEVPLHPTSANLAAAVASIPSGGSDSYLVKAPIGTIVIWSGTADNIPTGWQLCDGTNGTPDLRDKFVLGAGTTHNVGETGGNEEVTLTVEQMPKHNHTYGVARTASSAQAAPYIGYTNQIQVSTSQAGGSQPHPNMPPYYTLCYIIKVAADPADSVTQDELETALSGKQDTIAVADGLSKNGNTLSVDMPVRDLTQEEFDALPEEEKSKGLFFLPGDGESGGGGFNNIYSTDEVRIGTWVDGKPLYRKVVKTTFPQTKDGSGVSSAFATISGVTPSTVLKTYGGCWYCTNNYWAAIPSVRIASSSSIDIDVYSDVGGCSFRFSWYGSDVHYTNLSGSEAYIIIEYTKTTDQPET